jgi:glycosyltransferase involved in cell wall biosynthesis
MRIAQVAPLHESVPPKRYGGTERVVSLLTEELVAAGHDVTLYATGDSETRAELRSVCARGIREDPDCVDPLGIHFCMLEKLLRDAPDLDLVHFHTDILHLPFLRRLQCPYLTTLHGRLDLPHLDEVYAVYCESPVVSISNAQRTHMPDARWIGTVYHGIGADEFQLSYPRDGYLAFLGRISPEKRPDKAIELALETGNRIKLAAKVDKVDQDYFEEVVKPLLSHRDVEFVGEVNPREKKEFLEGASALLFPVDWPEPFGLVMIEAMACGAPVVAWNRGSVPEVVDEGLTGFIVESDDEAVEAIARCQEFDRQACRERFEERFLSKRMAGDYLQLYESISAPFEDNQAVA